jgi:hypothetical protein
MTSIASTSPVGCLVRVCQQHRSVELALRAVAVLGLAVTGLERAEAAELTLDRRAHHVRELGHLLGDLGVV